MDIQTEKLDQIIQMLATIQKILGPMAVDLHTLTQTIAFPSQQTGQLKR